MNIHIRSLRKNQLDQIFKKYQSVFSLKLKTSGWLKDIRETLGISSTQMACLLGMTRPAYYKIERSEAAQTASLKTIRKAAEAMDCRIVFAIVPKDGSLQHLIERRARQVARRILARVSHTMALENQSITMREQERQIKELANELIENRDKRLWNLDDI